MKRDQAVVNAWVLYLPWKGQDLRSKGRIVRGPDPEGMVHVCLGSGTYNVHIDDLQFIPEPLRDDLELIEVLVREEMKFVYDPDMEHPGQSCDGFHSMKRKLELIRYFEKAYSNTDQDTVLYGPEFVIVVRSILAGQRPVKLRYLTDFEGEEKSPLECVHANEVPSGCTCAKNCYCKTNTCVKEETKWTS